MAPIASAPTRETQTPAVCLLRCHDCGNPELNDYLRRTARQHTEKGLLRTEMLVDDEAPTEILGT
jgi:hypothetical protein